MSAPIHLQQNLRSHLLEIVRERDPYFATQGHFYVETYLRETLSQWGTVQIHEFKVKARTHRNFQLNLPSRDARDRPPILIGAHYDGVPHSPAADDKFLCNLRTCLHLKHFILLSAQRLP